jgi:hypothetical protein
MNAFDEKAAKTCQKCDFVLASAVEELKIACPENSFFVL